MNHIKTITYGIEELKLSHDYLLDIILRMWRFHHIPTYKEKEKGQIRNFEEGIEELKNISWEIGAITKKIERIKAQEDKNANKKSK